MKNRTSRISSRKSALACGLLLMGSLYIGAANAQWEVIDPTMIGQDATNFATTVEQYAKDVAQYQAVLAHYEQQLISLENMNFSLLQVTNNFTKRDPSQDVQLFCPGASVNILDLTSLLTQLAANLGENINAQQLQVCANTVQLQDAKFNETIDIIQRLTNENNNEISAIESQRNSVGTGEGALAANQNETARYVARTNTDIQTWQTRMKGYDVQIEFLKAQQAALAKRAMDGDTSNANLLGNATQAAALAAALKIGN